MHALGGVYFNPTLNCTGLKKKDVKGANLWLLLEDYEKDFK